MLTEVDLWEYSIVPWAMNPAAGVIATKDGKGADDASMLDQIIISQIEIRRDLHGYLLDSDKIRLLEAYQREFKRGH